MKLFFISDRIVFHISYAHTPNVNVDKGFGGFSQDTVDLLIPPFPSSWGLRQGVSSNNPEIAYKITFPPDDKHLFQFHQSHFYEIHHV